MFHSDHLIVTLLERLGWLADSKLADSNLEAIAWNCYKKKIGQFHFWSLLLISKVIDPVKSGYSLNYRMEPWILERNKNIPLSFELEAFKPFSSWYKANVVQYLVPDHYQTTVQFVLIDIDSIFSFTSLTGFSIRRTPLIWLSK